MSGPDPVEVFLQEAQELLEQLEQSLLDLGETPDDRDLVDSAFRALHTIKGSGSMFGFDRVAAFTHHVETAFDRVRKGHAIANPELIAVTLAAQDVMRRLIETPGEDTGEEQAILARLEAAIGPATDTAPPVAVAPEGTKAARKSATWRVRFHLAPSAMARGTNPLLLIQELCSLGECSVVALDGDVPALDSLEPTECHIGWDLVLTTDKPRSAIDDVFIFVIDDMELDVAEVEDTDGAKRLGEILIDRGEIKAGEIKDVLGRQERLGQLLVKAGAVSEDRVISALVEQQHVRQDAESGRSSAKGQATIRVTAERLDGLMDRVGELVIAQARLRQLAGSLDDLHLKSVAEEIERLASELRETTMGIRMVPIGTLFGRYRRLVHDLARDLGKEIRLTTSGEETELDKTVIERLADPLVHLIRNSIDHGLEDADTRVAAGKSRVGRLHLSAHHAGAQVLITIKDDGRGLDVARIRARAEENGLIPAGAKVSDAELFQYIFHAGFSTAKAVTSLSGRGVGMDVVKRTIESLRGTVDIASTPGGGTEATLRLPLTLAIIDGLLVRVGDGRYVLPLSAVEECVELTADEDVRSRGRNFLSIRGDLVPFLRLRELFAAKTPPDPYQKIVVVSAGEARVGLVVDQVIGDHQTVIKSLSKLHADVESFSGATILGDGTVALILDVTQLIAFGQAREERLKAS